MRCRRCGSSCRRRRRARRRSVPWNCPPTIDDRPALAYRGLMLDVARHFFTVEEVKRTLDLLALHKMNVFHWHLTDDQGWRIEIERYPELTRTGAVRRRTLIGRDPGGEYDATCRYDETPYGGYYTQEEIREVVDYAARRFITVIPEIEFPGHAVAALASYPWLSCTGERYEVRQTWDIDDRVFCPGRETTFEFIEHVLEEVIGLFPSEYVHIGGDECPTTLWERCPRCRARMRAEGLASPRQLQGYATARVERFLQRHGRRLIGWDELLEGGVSPTAVVMSWRGTEGGIRAAKQGNRVIMAPTTHCYLDYYQSADTAAEPLAWGGFLPLEKVYSFDPLEGLTSDEARFVLGVQANLWTEYIPDFGQAHTAPPPRLSALAEAGRNPQEKDYDLFSASSAAPDGPLRRLQIPIRPARSAPESILRNPRNIVRKKHPPEKNGGSNFEYRNAEIFQRSYEARIIIKYFNNNFQTADL